MDIDGVKIKWVKDFKYLGEVFEFDGSEEKTVQQRLAAAEQRCAIMGGIFFNKNVSRRLKYNTLKTYVYPVATYACETWTGWKRQDERLDVFWNKWVRIICETTKEEKNTTEMLLTSVRRTFLSEMVRRRRLKYFGHVVRYPAERLVRKSVTIEGEGRRKLGKQKQTWRGRVNADMKGARATVEDCKKVEKNGAWFKNPRWDPLWRKEE